MLYVLNVQTSLLNTLSYKIEKKLKIKNVYK